METLFIRAHFDGAQIYLDDPVELEAGTALLITVLPKRETAVTEEHNEWLSFALSNLDRWYGEDEPEYSLDMIKEPNPDYEGR